MGEWVEARRSSRILGPAVNVIFSPWNVTLENISLLDECRCAANLQWCLGVQEFKSVFPCLRLQCQCIPVIVCVPVTKVSVQVR